MFNIFGRFWWIFSLFRENLGGILPIFGNFSFYGGLLKTFLVPPVRDKPVLEDDVAMLDLRRHMRVRRSPPGWHWQSWPGRRWQAGCDCSPLSSVAPWTPSRDKHRCQAGQPWSLPSLPPLEIDIGHQVSFISGLGSGSSVVTYVTVRWQEGR